MIDIYIIAIAVCGYAIAGLLLALGVLIWRRCVDRETERLLVRVGLFVGVLEVMAVAWPLIVYTAIEEWRWK